MGAAPGGVFENLGSAAFENPVGSSKLFTNQGSTMLFFPVTGAQAASIANAEMIKDRDKADKAFDKAEGQDNSGKGNVFSHAMDHAQETSAKQTKADRAVTIIGIIVSILLIIVSTGILR